MSLRQRRITPVSHEVALEPEGVRLEKPGATKTGLFLVIAGVLLLLLAAGDALAGIPAGAVLGGSGADTLQGSDGRNWISGSGGADTLSGRAEDDLLVGGDGDDDIFGGPGSDKLLAGLGNDFVETRDGERDYVDCGPGQDAASVDDEDYVSGSCERVYAG